MLVVPEPDSGHLVPIEAGDTAGSGTAGDEAMAVATPLLSR